MSKIFYCFWQFQYFQDKNVQFLEVDIPQRIIST